MFSGYWNRPDETSSFLTRDGERWYNTGDVVQWDAAEGYSYVGRRDRMVKRRGYRIELGEIERALDQHSRVSEVAVVSAPGQDAQVKIIAFLACTPGGSPSIVELKTFCGDKLPAYMSPDRFVVLERLPRTSADKIDFRPYNIRFCRSRHEARIRDAGLCGSRPDGRCAAGHRAPLDTHTAGGRRVCQQPAPIERVG